VPEPGGNKMDVNQKVKVLEDEMKILKAEMKSVLLDIREQYLNNQNPFMSPGQMPESGAAGANGEAAHMAPSVIVRESIVERDRDRGRNGDLAADGQAEHSSGSAPVPQYQAPASPQPAYGTSGGQSVDAGDREEWLDLAVIAGLTEWVDRTTQRVGKQRAGAIVEGLHSIGRLPGGMKDFLVRFVSLSADTEPDRQLKARDYLTVLSQLEGLLGKSGKSELSLISILNSDEETEWTRQ
jgi:hypothetical protein